VESPLQDHRPGAARSPPGQGQGLLVGLGAGIDQEGLAQAFGGGLGQKFEELLPDLQPDGVGIEKELLRLGLHGLHHSRVAVARDRHGVPPVEIQVAPPLPVPDPAPLPAGGFQGKAGVYGKFRGMGVQHG